MTPYLQDGTELNWDPACPTPHKIAHQPGEGFLFCFAFCLFLRGLFSEILFSPSPQISLQTLTLILTLTLKAVDKPWEWRKEDRANCPPPSPPPPPPPLPPPPPPPLPPPLLLLLPLLLLNPESCRVHSLDSSTLIFFGIQLLTTPP